MWQTKHFEDSFLKHFSSDKISNDTFRSHLHSGNIQRANKQFQKKGE